MTFVVIGVVVVLLGVGLAVALRRSRRARESARRDSTLSAPAEERSPQLGVRLGSLFARPIDDQFWASFEETLVAADVGVGTVTEIVEAVRRSRPSTPDEARKALRAELIAAFDDIDRSVAGAGAPAVIVAVGVNGSGKTTTIAKLADRFVAEGSSVLVAAADTFRAAAAKQMVAWGEQVGFDVVRGADGADATAVAFDGLSAARARGTDVLIVDTAGRLHSKHNLMAELTKLVRVLEREAGAVDEVLLVLDGSTGLNGVAQAKAFTAAVGVTGVVLTKLDGSARGGVAVAVERDLGIPVKLIGVGEGSSDLLHFEPSTFVDAIMRDI